MHSRGYLSCADEKLSHLKIPIDHEVQVDSIKFITHKRGEDLGLRSGIEISQKFGRCIVEVT